MFNPANPGIFEISSPEEFNAKALEIFHFQAKNCQAYARFIEFLKVNPLRIKTIDEIPFLPVELFKSNVIYCGDRQPDLVFSSSGTTGQTPSRHFVTDPEIYHLSLLKQFEKVYGPVEECCILALLPGYLDRNNSSLVYMVNHLQQKSNHPLNGNFLHDFSALHQRLQILKNEKQHTVLFGVTFALLDFSNEFPNENHLLTIIETGGMKGQRKEITRHELHQILAEKLKGAIISSEYGMTELLSQAYSIGERFTPPNWMRVLCRDKTDPLRIHSSGSGGLNVIDLANYNSCSFIATGDGGKVFEDGSFEVLGRIDNQDIRGCNLMYA